MFYTVAMGLRMTDLSQSAGDLLFALPARDVSKLFRAGYVTREARDLRRNAEIRLGFRTYYGGPAATSEARRFDDDLEKGPRAFLDVPRKAELLLNVLALNDREPLQWRRLYDLRNPD